MKSKRPPFVPIDKRFAAAFKKIRREYSDIEAAFSLSLDVNCGKVKPIRAYARIWSWSNHRVKRFLDDPERGGLVVPAASHKRPTSVPPKPAEQQGIESAASQQRPKAVPQASHYLKEQRTKNKEKNNYTDHFEEFWSKYPRKISKKKAFEVWKRESLDNGPFKEIIKGATAYANHCSSEQTESKFIAHPTTWLNQERWTDEFDNKGGGAEYFDPFALKGGAVQ